jgi:hypothetical protein
MMDRIGNRLYAIIGLVGAVITIVPWALSDTVRVWVRDHSNWLYGALVLASLALVLLLGYARDLNRENRELKTIRKKPSSNDRGMFREVLAQIPRDGVIMTWLKTEFFVKRIPLANLDAVDKVCQKLSMNPLEFDNRHVNDAYESFKAAIEDFYTEINQWTKLEDGNYEFCHVPLPVDEEDEKTYYAALNEIKDSARKLISVYDDFLRTCSENGLDVYGSEPSPPREL